MEKNITIGKDAGGFGCLLLLIGIGILFNFGRILDIIEMAVSCK